MLIKISAFIVALFAAFAQVTSIPTTGSGPGASYYQTVQDEASDLTQRAKINFTGTGVTCVDNGGASRTDCTIPSGADTAPVVTTTATTVVIPNGAFAFCGNVQHTFGGPSTLTVTSGTGTVWVALNCTQAIPRWDFLHNVTASVTSGSATAQSGITSIATGYVLYATVPVTAGAVGSATMAFGRALGGAGNIIAGSNITATTDAQGRTTIAGTSAYQIVADEGSNLTARTTINFTGAGVTCADNGGSSRTDCTIAGGGGASDSSVTIEDLFLGSENTTSIAYSPFRWLVNGTWGSAEEVSYTVSSINYPWPIVGRTGAVSGNSASIMQGNNFFYRGLRGFTNPSGGQSWEYTAWIYIPTLTSVRIWNGLLTTSSGLNADTPTGRNVVGIRFSTNSGDTAFNLVVCDSVACSTQAAGSAVSANTWYKIKISMSSPTSVGWSVNGTSQTAITTNIPGSSAQFQLGNYVETLTAEERQLIVGGVRLALSGLTR